MPILILLLIAGLQTGCGGSSGSTTPLQAENTESPVLHGKPEAHNIHATHAGGIVIDGDINDPRAKSIDNNLLEQPQPVAAPGRVPGFLAVGGTGKFEDRFAFEGDTYDIYQAKLLMGDTLTLRAFNQEADLDLYVFNIEYDLISYSYATEGDEFIQIPEGNDYLIVVKAESNKVNHPYATKYQLTLAPRRNIEPSRYKNRSANFYRQDGVIFSRSQGMQGSQLALKKAGKPRRLKLENDIPYRTLSFAHPDVFKNALKHIHPESYTTLEALTALKSIRHNPEYQTVETNQKVYPFSAYNDPLSPLQWYLSIIKYSQANDLLSGLPRNEVIVAVIDNGIFLQHEDLQSRLVQGFDFVSSPAYSCDGDGIDPDPGDPGDKQYLGISTYHGTHVAGIIAANTDNALGIAGIADSVRIMPVRAIGCSDGSTYDLLQALRFAAGLPNDSGTIPDRPADIINLSLGTYSYSEGLQSLIKEITRKGIIIVAAAGNDATDLPAYPASYDHVISVSASNSLGQAAHYSNFGNRIDLAAPGGDFRIDHDGNGIPDGIISLVASDTGSALESDYRQYQGTSMAAPVVSGGLALLKSLDKSLTTADIESLIITQQLTQSESGTFSQSLGYGIIDLEKSLLSQMSPQATTARIFANRYQFYLTPYQTTALFRLQQTSGELITITGITSDAAWLTVSPATTDFQGLGSYNIHVTFDGLPFGQYRGQLEISADNDQTLTLNVEFNHREPVQLTDQADSGLVWLLLLDPDTRKVRYQIAAEQTQGRYQFPLQSIEEGSYLLIAGTDLDNDHQICTQGELCAGYPDTSKLTPVFIGKDNEVIIHLVLNAMSDTSLSINWISNDQI